MSEENYTVKDVAAYLKRATRTIYRYIEEGRFPHAFQPRRGSGWLIPQRDLDKLLESGRSQVPGAIR